MIIHPLSLRKRQYNKKIEVLGARRAGSENLDTTV